jgi:hypothetical protein
MMAGLGAVMGPGARELPAPAEVTGRARVVSAPPEETPRPDILHRVEGLLALNLTPHLELDPRRLVYRRSLEGQDVPGRRVEVRLEWAPGGAQAAVKLEL